MGAIILDNVSKRYYLHRRRQLLAKRAMEWLYWARRPSEELWALRDISFHIQPGERVAIVGRNGAGKSTLLSIVAGVTAPTSGRFQRTGRISALLELGSGFHADLTGRENAILNAGLLGLTGPEIRRKFDSIVSFSGLERFIDEPLRTYSSGMAARLGFSVAIHVEPEILVLDEVLSVGDAAFQIKSRERIDEMVASGVTLLVVAHDASIETICERALWLEKGRMRMDGDAKEVLSAYHDDTVPGSAEPASAA